MQWRAFLLFVIINAALARRGGRTFSKLAAENSAATTLSTDDRELTGARAALSNMVSSFVDGLQAKHNPAGLNIHAAIEKATKNVNLDEAVKRVESRLPSEVAALVRLASTGETYTSKKLEQGAIERARAIFNNMVFDAEAEMTLIIFECKEFHERNRLTYEQVTNDIARLGSQLGALNGKRMGANQCIETQEAQYKRVQAQLEAAHQAYRKQRDADDIEMTRRRNDLAVFEFVMEVTKCKADSKLLLQTDNNASQARFCSTAQGDIEIHFNNPKLQAQVEKMMTPDAKLALRTALGQVSGMSFLQGGETTTTTVAKYEAVAKRGSDPVAESPGSANSRKCADMPDDPNRCAKVHDTMSLEWGRFRDEVDELADEMQKNLEEWEKQRANFNEQMQGITDMSGKCQGELADATGDIDADLAEQQEKEKQARELEAHYRKTCAEFKKKITTILYEKICEIITVRNAVIDHDNSKAKPSDTTDCELSDWVPLNGKCITAAGKVITCDDTCPREDPNLCGGMETMSREIVIAPNEFGIKCGEMRKEKRCGQKKCPVDCAMSEWSGYSACSKECEGGIQIRTRYALQKPKNGGMGCDTVQEPRACNTGSCDRDCDLSEWSPYTFCTQACDSGLKWKTRKVTRPIRGNGKCPTTSSSHRYQEASCNTQACTGDEVCIAKQDLIIAMDASGSLREEGYKLVKNFVVNMTKRYSAKFGGQNETKMGAVAFGNGVLTAQADGTMVISEAMKISDLTFDFASVRTEIDKVTWQKGFTNMAQALLKAKNLLGRGGRHDAQSAVLVISDGKPSFKYQTAQAAQELKDQGIMIYMAPIAEFDNEELSFLKAWASKPTETNYLRIPGMQVLGGMGEDVYIQKLIVKFCPNAYSPASMNAQADLRNFILIRKNGYPNVPHNGKIWARLGYFPTPEGCFDRARMANRGLFIYGTMTIVSQWYARANECWGIRSEETNEYYDKNKRNHMEPEVPKLVDLEKTGWFERMGWDAYIINPRLLKTDEGGKK